MYVASAIVDWLQYVVLLIIVISYSYGLCLLCYVKIASAKYHGKLQLLA